MPAVDEAHSPSAMNIACSDGNDTRVDYLDFGDAPVLDLKPEIFGKVYPLVRFWNANDISLTHLFNAIVMVDIVMMRFGVKVLERVKSEVGDKLSARELDGFTAYMEQLGMELRQFERHWQAMRDIGYENDVVASYEKRLEGYLERWSAADLLAMWNAHCWQILSLGRYLFKMHWFLALAESRPAMRFKWKLAAEFLHTGSLTPAVRLLPVSRLKALRLFIHDDIFARSMFFVCNNYLMRKDLATENTNSSWLRQTWTIARFQTRLFFKPFDGYFWEWLGYYGKYMRSNGDSACLDCTESLNDFLLNSQLFVEQVNPAVSDSDFFPNV